MRGSPHPGEESRTRRAGNLLSHVKATLFLFCFFADGLYFGTLALLSRTHLPGGGSFTIFNSVVILGITGVTVLGILKGSRDRAKGFSRAALQIVGLLAFYVFNILLDYAEFSPALWLSKLTPYFLAFSVPAALLALSISEADVVRMFQKLVYVNLYLSVCFAVALTHQDSLTFGYFNNISGGSHLVIGYTAAALFGFNLLMVIRPQRLASRILYLGLTVGDVLLTILSSTRGALACLAAVFLVVTFRHLLNRRMWPLCLALLGAGVAMLFILSGQQSFNAPIQRIFGADTSPTSAGLGGEQSTEAHLQLFSVALKGFEHSPVIGNGLGSFSNEVGFYDYPHDLFLEIMNDFGLCGLSVFCLILVGLGTRALRMLKSSSLPWQCVVLLFVSTVVQLLFGGSYIVSAELWLTGSLIWISPKGRKAPSAAVADGQHCVYSEGRGPRSGSYFPGQQNAIVRVRRWVE